MKETFKTPFQYPKPTVPLAKTGKRLKTDDLKAGFGTTIFRVWHYLTNFRLKLMLVILMVIVNVAATILGPFLIGEIIDHYLVPFHAKALLMMLGLTLGIYLLLSASTWFENYYMIDVGQQTIFNLRKELFEKFQKLPMAFFEKRQNGDLMSRMTNDIDNVGRSLNDSIIEILSSLLTFVGILCFMLYLSPILTAISVLVIPIMYVGMRWITRRTSVYFKEQQRELGKLNAFMEETVSGQLTVKTFHREDQTLKEFDEQSKRYRNAGFWSQIFSGIIPKLMNSLTAFGYAIVAFAGGALALQPHTGVSIGMIVVFLEYVRQFIRPLNDLANQFNALLSAVAGAERVFEILDEKPEQDAPDAKAVSKIKGRVDFEEVSFGYDENEILHHVSLHANSGETIALVGPTGSGKTTIISLLSHFYKPNQGIIKIDAIDLQKITKESYRKQLAFVFQETFLIRGTIAENIRLSKPDATQMELEAAAKMANADSFIQALPNQYETYLEQDGTGISQGQRQLLSIARAFLANPHILIMDEATSNIDTVTEMKIQEAMQRLASTRTTFLVAHRLNTVREADQIYVLEKGTIKEHGNHKSLMAKKGYYYQLYQNYQASNSFEA